MGMIDGVDYGPLSELVGEWTGDKGLDVAPEPDGEENNPYYETIIFSAIGDLDNAETQKIAAIHYRQIVKRKSNDEVFHDETGYWMWDAASKTMMHSLTIPRAVSVLAGAVYNGETSDDGRVSLHVSASVESNDWQIIQSPFMRDNAKTTAFEHRIQVGDGRLHYLETTTLEIYGRVFSHTDENELVRQ